MRKPRILVLEGLSHSAQCVRNAGGNAISVSPTNLEKVFNQFDNEHIDGMVLTGGGDVDPRQYAKKIHKQVYGVDETRDAIEIYALEMARDMNIPVLGICRGHQIQNVESGGTLHQHIGHAHYGEHLVIAHRDSILRRVFGARDQYVVSLHHQEVKDLGNDYRVTGMAPDGTVETIETIDGRCLGVQFHPEMDSNQGYSRRIFRWLVEESAERAGLPIEPLPKRTLKPRHSGGKVIHSWFCQKCGMKFDKLNDRDDHAVYVHNSVGWVSGLKVDAPYSRTPLGQLSLMPGEQDTF